MIRRLHALARDRRGATIIEFAIVTPVMLLLIMGLSEICYQAYVQVVLSGAMQKAGRDSAIQGSAQKTADIDSIVMNAVWQIAKKATYVSTRKNYYQFGNTKGEPFTDSQKNGSWSYDGVCNHGEPYTDINNDGSYSLDPGSSGQGGPNDAVVYTVKVTFPHLFPLGKVIGWSADQTITSTTILKNQPYATQSTRGTTTRNCT